MKNRKIKSLCLGIMATIFTVTVVLNLFSIPFAIAQEEEVQQKTTQEKKAPEEYELETITVTVQKREENIQ
ncbi:MAG: hypothetical protein IMF11_20775, partial [Proteobacteria bacterium]|nr:hypothetical protein [Pseudomonadota bacterium]